MRSDACATEWKVTCHAHSNRRYSTFIKHRCSLPYLVNATLEMLVIPGKASSVVTLWRSWKIGSTSMAKGMKVETNHVTAGLVEALSTVS